MSEENDRERERERESEQEEGSLLDAPISRRSLFKRAAVVGAALSIPAIAAACGGEEEEEAAPPPPEEAPPPPEEAPAQGEGAGLTFYSVTHGESGNVFWAIYRNGIRDGAALFGAEVKDLPLETFAVAGYIDLLETAIAAQPDGIFATILDQAAVDEPLRRAIDQGIPVIAVNVPDTRPLAERIPYMFYVGGDEEAGGRLTAQRQLAEKPGIKRAACVIHEPGHTGLEARCRGYEAELSAAGAKVDKLPSTKDATQATEQIKGFVTANPDVEAIFGVGPQPATFSLQALDELGKKGQVLVSAYDMTEDLLNEIEAGNITSTIDQQQYLQGWEPINWLVKHIRHGFVLAPGVDMLTGPALVDKSNFEKVREGVAAGFR